ncbi:MAG: DNA polymerase [Cetobacterium sp.]
MGRQLNFTLDREEVNINNITDKLKHRKNCVMGNTRVYNSRKKIVAMAQELLESGRLYKECDVEMITTLERLEDYTEQIKKVGAYVLDMETTGLDIFNDVIVGMCIYVEGLPSAYIPVNHTDIDNNRLEGQLEEEQLKEGFREVLEDKNIKCILHNAKFDYKVLLWCWDIKIANVYWDTMIGAFILNENEKHGLKPLYNKYVNGGKGSDEDYGDYFGSNTTFNYIPLNVALLYGANDGIKTWKLYKFQSKYLNPNHPREDFRKLYNIFMEIEMPLIPHLADLELKGIAIRPDYAKTLSIEMEGQLKAVIELMDKDILEIREEILKNDKLFNLTKGEGKINYSSPSQLQILFYDIMKLKSGDRKNPRGTGVEVIEKLVKKYPKIKFLTNLLEYRRLSKLLTTYVEKIPNILEPKTNAVHSNFNQIGTATGRFSSSHPVTKLNLQNIPSKEKRIRKIFRAREGKYFIGGDFSQIEPRTLASMSGDEHMIEAYKEGKDLYAMMASKVYNMPVEECLEFREDGTTNAEGKARRNSMKSVLLGIMYCRGAKSIGEQLGKSEKYANDLIENFNKEFPRVKEMAQKVVYQAEKLGFVNTLFGRKRRLVDMQLSRDDYRYQQAYRQCLNAVIQGTAGDIMKKALYRVATDERATSLGIQIVLTIHDELICEVPKENAKKGAEVLATLMKEVCFECLGIPAKVDIEATEVWYGEGVDL